MPTNFYATFTANTPALTLGDGFDASIIDAAGAQTINIEDGATVDLQASAGENVINLEGGAADYTVTGDGFGNMTLTHGTTGATVTLAARSTAQTLVFSDGAADLSITDSEVVLGDQTVTSASDAAISATLDSTNTSQEEFGGETTTGPTISIDDAEATEGDNDTIDFTVNLSAAQDSDVTVDYATVADSGAGAAVASSDYTHVNGTLTIAAGETSGTIQVDLVDNNVFDGTATNTDGVETFTVQLSNASTGTISDATATGTINDDEENSDPVNTVPAENPSVVLATTQAVEGISVADANNNNLTVTVSASNGLLATSASGNISAQTGAEISLVGSKSDINGALATLTYTSDRTLAGEDTITVTTEDVFGGTDTDTVTVDVENGFIFTAAATDDFTGDDGGTSANEQFIGVGNAGATTFQSGDDADGGGGTDTLVLTEETAAGHLTANNTGLANIEVLNLTTDDSGGAETMAADNTNDFGGDLTTVIFTDGDGAGSNNSGTEDSLALTSLSDGSTVTINSSLDDGGNGLDVDMGTGADELTLNLAGDVTVSVFDNTTSDISTLSINSNGSNANEITALGTNAGLAAASTVEISGAADFTTTFADIDVDSIDGSEATGDLTIDASAITTDAAADGMTLSGGSGDDTLTGGSTTNGDTIEGNAGDDTITGSSSADTIKGGAGDDTIDGGGGADVAIEGGTGADSFTVEGGDDRIIINSGDTGSTDATRDSIDGITEGFELDLSDYGDLEDVFGLANGADLATSASDDSAREIYIDKAKDSIVIEMDAAGSSTEEIDIGVADGAAVTSDGDGILTFGAVPVTSYIEGSYVMVEGQNATGGLLSIDLSTAIPEVGGNAVSGASSSYANTDASGVTDQGVTVSGSTVKNVIIGSGEDDTIDGGVGNDSLTGGLGSDTFVYDAATDGVDRYTDFDWGAATDDVLQLTASGAIADFAAGAGTVSTGIDGGNVAVASIAADTAIADASTNELYVITSGADDTQIAKTATQANIESAIAAELSDGTDIAANALAGEGFYGLIANDADGDSTVDSYFMFEYIADATPATSASADITLLGIFDGTDAANVAAADFV